MKQHISFQTNVTATQITETDDRFMLEDIPVVVDGAKMNGIEYTKEENAKGLPSIVNCVVTLRHPFDDKGHPIDAYSPQALQNQFSGGVVTRTYKVGKINMVAVDIKKAILKAQDNGQAYYDRLHNREEIGVSTGLYTQVVNGVATEQQYNHLAMLDEGEEPAGGDATKMKFNSADTLVVNIDELIASVENPDAEESPATLLQKLTNAVKNLTDIFANRQKVDDNTNGRGQRDNKEKVQTMLSREQVINMLKGKGVAVDENHTDAQLTEQLTNALAAKPAEPKGEPVVNADFTAAMTAAINAAVKPLADELKAIKTNEQAKAQAAKDAVIGQIVATNAVYTKDELEQMPETVLNKLAAQLVPAYGLGRGVTQFNSASEALPEMPE